MTKFYTQDVPRYDYDPRLAEQLLDQAGYPRKSGGVRFAITDDFMPFNEAFRNNAEFIRQDLKRVGIDMTVRSPRGFDPVPIDRQVIADQQRTVDLYVRERVLPGPQDVAAGFEMSFR